MKESDFYKMYIKKIANKGGIGGYVEHKKSGPVGNIVKRVESSLNKNTKILEIGTGTGVLASLLVKSGFSVTAIDIDERMLNIAKGCANYLNIRLNLRVLNAFELRQFYNEKEFGCVVSYGLMEHFSDEQIINLIKIQNYLAKLVIFCVPSSNISLKYQKKGNGTERYLDKRKWVEIIKKSGVKEYIFYGFGYGSKSKYSFIPQRCSFLNLTSRIFSRFAGFYEIWLLS